VQLAVTTGNNRVAWQIPALPNGPYARVNAFDDWFHTTELGLAAARKLDDTVGEGFLLWSLTMAYRQIHRLDKAQETGQQALQLFRRIGHPRGEALSSNLLAIVSLLARNIDTAHNYLDEAENLAGNHNYADIIALVIINRSWAYMESDRYQEAYDYTTSTLELVRASGNKNSASIEPLVNLMRAAHGLGRYNEAAHWAEIVLPISPTKSFDGYVLNLYGDIQRDRGDPESALITYHRAAGIHRQFGDRNKLAEVLDATGIAYTLLGRFDEAAHFHLEAIELYRSVDSKWGTAIALDHLARASVDLSKHEDAARHWNEALTMIGDFDDPVATTLRDSIGLSLQQLTSPDQRSAQQDDT